ncbi:MAG: hypothetical protein QNJ31_03680 [Candidatus Caenarcaniphilales bacterium]|nr:hypothetical protein [Candidatus Caenarcaniphilales bacterium]
MELSQEILERKVISALNDRARVDKISISILDLSNQISRSVQKSKERLVSINGEIPRYPASIIKLFWAYQALYQLQNSNNLDFLLEHMLVNSSDAAGQELVDLLTKTHEVEIHNFEYAYAQRAELDNFWKAFGFRDLKARHKTFLDNYLNLDAWIKEVKGPNTVTSNMVVNLWKQIWINDSEPKLLETKRVEFLKWLKRKPTKAPILPSLFDSYCINRDKKAIDMKLDINNFDGDFQASLIGFNLPKDCDLYTKSGWRDDFICDSGIIRKNSKCYAISVFSELPLKDGLEFIRNFQFSFLIE